MPPLKSPTHSHQIAAGFCLPACAQMALNQLGLDASQPHIAQVLGTRMGIGTPFSRIQRLTHWHVQVRLVTPATLAALTDVLAAAAAIIVPVMTTSGLPGWATCARRTVCSSLTSRTNRSLTMTRPLRKALSQPCWLSFCWRGATWTSKRRSSIAD